jgi:cytochrome c oxidase subunit IV
MAMRREYRRLLWTWLALMVLLGLTFGSAWLRMGMWNNIVNLAIAAIKAGLVGMIFMRLVSERALIRLCAATALFTLALLFAISSSDYATRTVYRAPWQALPTPMPK